MIHLDESRSAEAIQAGWLAYRDRLEGWKEAYDEFCKAWKVVAVVNDDEVIGALFVKDGVIHLGIKPEWQKRWASRRVINLMLSYGRKTTVRDWEEGCLRFIKRIGFKRSGDGYEIQGDCRVDHR